MKNIAAFILSFLMCFVLQPSFTRADDDSYTDADQSPFGHWEKAKEKQNDSYSPCYDRTCGHDNKKGTDDESETQIENSFRQEGVNRNSITSIQMQQLKQR